MSIHNIEVALLDDAVVCGDRNVRAVASGVAGTITADCVGSAELWDDALNVQVL